ncbi:MAG: D-alanyl-D-alanine carboxypeptidase [Oscillospiraceae bacterium]|nr:D-alanyl-D-alanine carboxypeptidase [Oscillospiraceae bacterium]
MKKTKFFSLLLVVSFLTALLCPLSASALEIIDTSAAAAILAEADSGKVLYEKNADEVRAPASITKLMTVLLAVEAVERGDVQLTDQVTASELSRDDLTYDSSTQNIQPGEIMPFEELLYCALVASANEAANIIAEHVSGSREDFITLMNSRAKELGCTSTHFVNTHGLPAEGHYSTARDISKIALEAINHPLLLEISGTKSREIPATNMSDVRFIKNTNILILIDNNSSLYYKPATGLKTGYTEAAGYCLAASAEKDGIRMVCVVLGAGIETADDGTNVPQSFAEAKKIFEWGYESYAYISIINGGELIKEVPVALGDGADSVIARVETGITAFLPVDIAQEDFERKVTIFSEEEGAERLEAPIKAGDVLGEIELTLKGESYGKVNLVANTNIERSEYESFKDSVDKLLTSKWLRITLLSLAVLIVFVVVFFIVYNARRLNKRRKAWNINRGRTEEDSIKK